MSLLKIFSCNQAPYQTTILARLASTGFERRTVQTSAWIKRSCAAIREMKIYLALDPNAADARAAQDKIYEWEAKAK